MGGRQVPLGKKDILPAATDAILEKGKEIIGGSPNEQTLRYFKNQKSKAERAIKSQNGKIIEFPKVNRYTSTQSTGADTVKIIKPTPATKSKTIIKTKRYTK